MAAGENDLPNRQREEPSDTPVDYREVRLGLTAQAVSAKPQRGGLRCRSRATVEATIACSSHPCWLRTAAFQRTHRIDSSAIGSSVPANDQSLRDRALREEPRSRQRALGVLVGPALEFGHGEQAKAPAPDHAQVGLDVTLERIDAHRERGSGLGLRDSDRPNPRASFGGHGALWPIGGTSSEGMYLQLS